MKTTIVVIAIIVAIVELGFSIMLLLEPKQKTITDPSTKNRSISPVETVPVEIQKNPPAQQNTNTALTSCAETKTCASGFVCYHSQYGGLGPSGVVTGEEEGDLLCHQDCVTDTDCPNGSCEKIQLTEGDTVRSVNLCINEPTAYPSSDDSIPADWKRYGNSYDGYVIKYPPHYQVEELEPNDIVVDPTKTIHILRGITLYDPNNENDRISIEITGNPKILEYLNLTSASPTVSFSGKSFQKFQHIGEGAGYGYVTQRVNSYLIFETTIGPNNDTFETMMKSLHLSR